MELSKPAFPRVIITVDHTLSSLNELRTSTCNCVPMVCVWIYAVAYTHAFIYMYMYVHKCMHIYVCTLKGALYNLCVEKPSCVFITEIPRTNDFVQKSPCVDEYLPNVTGRFCTYRAFTWSIGPWYSTHVPCCRFV